MARYFTISGYWKDDKSEFTDYLVTDYDDHNFEDDNIFFYGLSESDIIGCINDEDTALEFVITSYKELYRP